MKMLHLGNRKHLASVGLLVLVVLLALWLLSRSSILRHPVSDDANDRSLSPDAQRAIKQGKAAASQKPPAWAVAVSYFDAARNAAPLSPEPLYFLGLAEAQMPGRELRAICWFEAYLGLVPQGEKSAQVRAWINELEVKARSNLNSIQNRLKQLADTMDFECYREHERDYIESLTLPDPAEASSPTHYISSFSKAFARWQARRWIALADQRMNIPAFLEFDRALGNASDGHPLEGRYPYRPSPYKIPNIDCLLPEPGHDSTPAQVQIDKSFYSILGVGLDHLTGLEDVLNTRVFLEDLEPDLNKPNIRSILGPWLCAGDFSEGLAAVSDSGYSYHEDLRWERYIPMGRCYDGWGFIDKAGVFVIAPELHSNLTIPEFSGGFASLGDGRFIDKTGTLKITSSWQHTGNFHDGLAAVSNGSEWGFINTSGDTVIVPMWDDVHDFHEGFAAVEKGLKGDGGHFLFRFPGTKWGFINASGDIVIETTWDWVFDFSGGHAAGLKGGKWQLIDKSGNVVGDLTQNQVQERLTSTEGFIRKSVREPSAGRLVEAYILIDIVK